MTAKTRDFKALAIALIVALGATSTTAAENAQQKSAALMINGGGGFETRSIDRSGRIRSLGAISRFGSVVVNGVEFETNSAIITRDGQVVEQADLFVGDMVLIDGYRDASGVMGIADMVAANDAVEGPITQIDIAANRLIVLGQIVSVSVDTLLETELNELTINDIVEVSGVRDAAGVIRATRLQVTGSEEFEVSGSVVNFDGGAGGFSIGTLPVDFSTARLGDFGASGLGDGDLVEVKGSSLNAAGVLLATRVEPISSLGTNVGEVESEVEGVVTAVRSSTEFLLNGQLVLHGPATRFVGGTAASLLLNVRLEVEGVLGTDDVLRAEVISFRPEANSRIVAHVQAVDSHTQSLRLLGLNATVVDYSQLEDRSDLAESPFDLGALDVGDYVEIRGVESSTGFVATRIERNDPRVRFRVDGAVDKKGTRNLVVLGISISTNAQTEYEDANGNAMSRAQFFAAVTVGRAVEVDSRRVTGTSSVLAREISLAR